MVAFSAVSGFDPEVTAQQCGGSQGDVAHPRHQLRSLQSESGGAAPLDPAACLPPWGTGRDRVVAGVGPASPGVGVAGAWTWQGGGWAGVGACLLGSLRSAGVTLHCGRHPAGSGHPTAALPPHPCPRASLKVGAVSPALPQDPPGVQPWALAHSQGDCGGSRQRTHSTCEVPSRCLSS